MQLDSKQNTKTLINADAESIYYYRNEIDAIYLPDFVYLIIPYLYKNVLQTLKQRLML